MINHIEILRQFVYEAGQEYGSVSGEMAMQSLKAIEGELFITDTLNENLQRVVSAIPPCPVHGVICIPHAIEWIEQVKTLAKVVAG